MSEQIEETMDRKNLIAMKLLHYFITEKNYNPILLQGVENEIWLENLNQDYKIIRIVSNYIHNNEQFAFDLFKTKRIMKKIKAKTLSFHLNTLSIFTDLGDYVDMESVKDIDCIKVFEEKDLASYDQIQQSFPDMIKKLAFHEEGMQLFLKITSDINEHNKTDSVKIEEVFRPKKPMVTYTLIAINVVLYFLSLLFGFDKVVDQFCVHGPSIRILGEYYRLLTGTFLHGGLMHLLFNCYALFVIGSQLESFIGKWKFMIIYLFSALTGSLTSIIFSGNGASIGASGAIFGLIGALLYFGYHYRVYLGNVMKSQIIPLVIFNLLFGFMMTGIDNAAHIGGLIGGTLMMICLGVKYKSSKFEQINGVIVTVLFTIFLLYMGLIYAA